MIDTKKRIRDHEGCVQEVYSDSLGLKTFGIGHLLTDKDDFKEGVTYPMEVIDKLFEEDYNNDIPFDPMVESVLIEMAFQLGLPRLKKFVKFIEGLQEEDYRKSADEMLDSRWANQTRARALELSTLIRNIK